MAEYINRECDPDMKEIAELRKTKTDEELDAEFEEAKERILKERHDKK